MSKDRGTPVDSFAELESFFKDLSFEIPKIDKEMLEDPSRLDEVKNKKLEICRKIQSEMASALKGVEKVTDWLNNCTDRLERKIAQAQVGEYKERAERFILERLKTDDLIFRSVAAQSVFMHFFKKEVTCLEDRDQTAKALEEYKLLVRSEQGSVRIGYLKFHISREFGLDEEDRQEIGRTYEEFNRSLELIEKRRRQQNHDMMKTMSNISFAEFKSGVAGKFLLEVPPEQQSEEKFLGGGSILLENAEIDGKMYVFPSPDAECSSSGKIERSIASMVEEGVKLLHETIFDKEPPGGPTLIKKIEIDHHLTYDNAYRHVGKMRSLWHMIKRGARQMDESLARKEAAIQKLEAFRNEADINPEEFFGLGMERKLGMAFLEFPGVYMDEGRPCYYLSLLIERLEMDGRIGIVIQDAPDDYANGLLKEFIRVFFEEFDENFVTGIPKTVGRILRAIRGKVEKDLQLNEVSAA